ncbi:kinesin-like protein Klp10A isoform X3 [Episyrphus balteatus]|uniref:kinesin-like protein Klp10A isoform X3 n=1 Tax=Episyrphus balteatus TaxID=286459 RepID=UPI00248500C7|nr:kinesin-like protein Klp10A isoform X3 [Episyrphus balteatus]XP_055845127.1 kinesin-like protein Klp10A isoform X3 [Episyrphus balteatus]XP_055845128.1 kinesin-like protein Klp10A isoform X3 [Episyrphus balteatus]XP_055845129.1 kinesin-like protein Klp10A isoform X3 [Episyrphus balteatus]XP_055845130.1 kinesin-like protein Klp10A isoform X3 [Episyrphus balteatus]
MDLIEVGQSVKIKRTDGRVHPAVVSKINEASRSFTVEWYERGETKGKEVELDAILQLNEDIVQERHAPPEPKIPATLPAPTPIQQVSAPMNLSREPSHSSIEEEDEEDDEELEDNDGVDQMRTSIGGTSQSGGTGGSGGSGGGTLPIRQSNSRLTSNATHGAIRMLNNVQNGHRTNRATLSQSAINTNGQSEHAENIPPPSGIARSRTTNNTRNMTTTTASSSVANNNAGPRRSYVVKEVERLKENREKRRARQAELKEEKTALMNLDPGNPNWETAAMIREYQNNLDFRPLTDGQMIEDHQITVCVRKRPLSRKENMRKEIDVISVPCKDTLIVHEPKNKVDLTKFLENHKFRFDFAFDDQCNNEMVYKYTAKPLVKTIFDGGMATCFAYGQTGSGKTHTMGGEFNGKIQDCKNGIYAMAAKDVFAYLNGTRYRSLNLVVSASFFEIYSGKVFDLLSDKQKLRVLEDGKQQVQVVGLTEKVVDSVEEVLRLIQHGNNARTSGQTSANSNSSRSHAVFQIVLRPPGSTKIHGKFSFIDLAGNERGADTSSANRQTRMEGAEINKSLLALKECIRALGKQSAHLPFRVSKLTQVLRDSFIGEKSKTCMIAMISPGLSSCEHTLNTLRYADRVKELVVKDPELRNDDDVEQMMEDDDHKNGEINENEYAHLRSLNEHDMSEELLDQHAAISDLQCAEEIVVDQHKAINEFLTQFLPESHKLYNQTNYVDYDQDTYCKQGEELFTQLAEIATSCRDSMADFRRKLAKEEMLSCTMKPGKR